MPRDDYERRRLRALYERNKRRISALADARDLRRDEENEMNAPRRFLVSGRRLRDAGFGRGQVQVRRIWRRQEERNPNRRFGNNDIYRRFNRDRFSRFSDFRQGIARRDRYHDRDFAGNRRLESTGTRRFGDFRRSRFAFRTRYQRGNNYRDLENRNNNDRRMILEKRAPFNNTEYDRQFNSKDFENRNNRRGNDSTYRRNDNQSSKDRANFSYSGRNTRTYRRGDNTPRSGFNRITSDELDAQLDAYRNHEEG